MERPGKAEAKYPAWVKRLNSSITVNIGCKFVILGDGFTITSKPQ